ncbi:hypothetical protein ACHAWF_005484 [Thalassiosira exigua]
MGSPPGSRRSIQFHGVEGVFALTAFVLTWSGSLRCDFVKFTSTSGSSEPITLNFGIWYYRFWSLVATIDGTYLVESCQAYPDSAVVDPAWKAARAFSVITFFFAVILLVVAIMSMCQGSILSNTRMAPLYLLTSLCQGLMLLLLQSNVCKNNALVQLGQSGVAFEDTCSIATGAKLGISALVFWAAAGACSGVAYQAEQEEAAEEVEAGLREPLAS